MHKQTRQNLVNKCPSRIKKHHSSLRTSPPVFFTCTRQPACITECRTWSVSNRGFPVGQDQLTRGSGGCGKGVVLTETRVRSHKMEQQQLWSAVAKKTQKKCTLSRGVCEKVFFFVPFMDENIWVARICVCVDISTDYCSCKFSNMQQWSHKGPFWERNNPV